MASAEDEGGRCFEDRPAPPAAGADRQRAIRRFPHQSVVNPWGKRSMKSPSAQAAPSAAATTCSWASPLVAVGDVVGDGVS